MKPLKPSFISRELKNCEPVLLFPVKRHRGEDVYLERNVLPKGDVSRHRQVVELQHVRDALEAGQVLLNLDEEEEEGSFDKTFKCIDKESRL